MTDHVLVINCGSSSLKFAAIDPRTGVAALTGLAERLGSPEASLSARLGEDRHGVTLAGGGHEAAMRAVLDVLDASGLTTRIGAVGHRVVHGGERFKSSVRIDDAVEAEIDACARLAPLHNPANLIGVRVARRCFPSLPHVAVFDTAFHQSMPAHAYLYAIPHSLYAEHGLRRYGFHGTSHRYVAAEAAQLLIESAIYPSQRL
jgi:acetate kinase